MCFLLVLLVLYFLCLSFFASCLSCPVLSFPSFALLCCSVPFCPFVAVRTDLAPSPIFPAPRTTSWAPPTHRAQQLCSLAAPQIRGEDLEEEPRLAADGNGRPRVAGPRATVSEVAPDGEEEESQGLWIEAEGFSGEEKAWGIFRQGLGWEDSNCLALKATLRSPMPERFSLFGSQGRTQLWRGGGCLDLGAPSVWR